MKLTTRKSMGYSAINPISENDKPDVGFIYQELKTGDEYIVEFKILGLYLVETINSFRNRFYKLSKSLFRNLSI